MKLELLVLVLCFSFQTLVSRALECSSSKVAYTITVSQSGNANFTTIADALKFIPSGNNQWVKILLKPGTYKEKIEIQQDKGCIVLEGEDRNTTKITYDAHSNTFESVTFSVLMDNFVAKRVTFENSYNIIKKDTLPGVIPAVAYKSYGDKHAFYSCGFVGFQDTIWDDIGRHYFKSCYIEGAVDFIWGNGQSVYEDCEINVTGEGYITAHGRESANDTSGYVFRGCNVSGTGKVVLGRAYRSFARVIFIESKFDNVINPEGWFIWHQAGHEKDITYAEVNCKGPGANTSNRVPWEKKLDASQVEQYTTQAFVDHDGWIAKQPL
ncbi:probable pectinesterase 55 [Spinacia oleracea]|uniref:pectinesterase n=1 Tax=Spinacia oleracea TaxID=3562 RepID=A0ABM3QIN1_SPIOL|nr:probable pectinesterase 55 [Spinacia oleracea]